jgi:hypothetical protein
MLLQNKKQNQKSSSGIVLNLPSKKTIPLPCGITRNATRLKLLYKQQLYRLIQSRGYPTTFFF